MIILGMLFLMPGFFLPVEDMPPSVSWIPYLIATSASAALACRRRSTLEWAQGDTGVTICPRCSHPLPPPSPPLSAAWATEGSLLNALKGQRFTLPNGGTIGGMDIFTGVYKYDSDVNKWEDWVIVLAWVFLFRIMHYVLMRWTNRHFGKSQASEASAAAKPTTASASSNSRVITTPV